MSKLQKYVEYFVMSIYDCTLFFLKKKKQYSDFYKTLKVIYISPHSSSLDLQLPKVIQGLCRRPIAWCSLWLKMIAVSQICL